MCFPSINFNWADLNGDMHSGKDAVGLAPVTLSCSGRPQTQSHELYNKTRCGKFSAAAGKNQERQQKRDDHKCIISN